MGKMGLLHASIVNTLPGVRLLAMYDKNSTMVRFAKKTFTEICVTDNLEKFSDFHLDAVYVTTPIPTHFSIVKAIYSRGIAKNLFVEKTLASSHEQAAQLCQEAKAAGGVTMVGYMSRFSPTFKKAKALLQEEVIGKLISFKAYAYASDFVGVKGKPLPVKGGATRDLGAHIIDLSLWFFGDLAVELSKLEPSAQEDNESGAYFRVRGSNGLAGEFDISWCKEGYRLPEFGLIISGSKGAITVNTDIVKLGKRGADLLTWHRHDLNVDVPFFLGAPEYFREDEHFVRSILESSIADPDFNTASKVDFFVEQVERQIGA
jgi:predicted dehydrogenase